MKIDPNPQGSPGWHEARRGLPTASKASMLLTPTGKPSTSQEAYINELILERLNCGPKPFCNEAIRQGVELEPIARLWAEMEYGKIQEVGLCLTDDGLYGASPDGLIGDDVGIEIKCPEEKQFLKLMRAKTDECPADYRCQIHANMVVTGRWGWKLVVYNETFAEPLEWHVAADAFTAAMADQIAAFKVKYAKAIKEIEPTLVNGWPPPPEYPIEEADRNQA